MCAEPASLLPPPPFSDHPIGLVDVLWKTQHRTSVLLEFVLFFEHLFFSVFWHTCARMRT